MKEYQINIGLLVEKTGKQITRKDAIAALAATGFGSFANLVFEGEWEGQPQPTLVVVGHAPANWSADALADELQQDSIAVLEEDSGLGRLDGPNPQNYEFDHGLFTTFEQAVDAELERRKRLAWLDLEHARCVGKAHAKEASDKAFLAAIQPA